MKYFNGRTMFSVYMFQYKSKRILKQSLKLNKWLLFSKTSIGENIYMTGINLEFNSFTTQDQSNTGIGHRYVNMLPTAIFQ